MKQNNCKSENVRAGTRRQACRRVPAVPLHYPQGGVHSLALSHSLIPFLIPIPLSHSRKTSAFATNSGQVSLAIKEIIATRSIED